MSLLRRLRGVRARLVVTYVVAAVVLAAAGVVLFSLALGKGLRDGVDTGLQAPLATVAADVASGRALTSTPPPAIVPVHNGTELTTFTAVYAPGGQLAYAQPNRLPGSPLTTRQLTDSTTVPAYRTIRLGHAPFRVASESITRTDGVWIVVAAQSLDAATDAESEVQQALLIAVPILLILVGLGAWLLSGAALKSVDRMRADAQTLIEDDSSGRIREPDTDDSLNKLAMTFNELLDRLHTSLDRQRGLVADAGHELRTPLAVLQTELETAARPSRTRADLVESISYARVEVSRLAALAEDLLLLAQADGGQPLIRRQLTDVGDLVDATALAWRAQAGPVPIVVARPSVVVADIDPVALRRILDNLLANAVRHTPSGGSVTVQVDDADSLQLTVADTGPGFDEAFLPHAFERFTRADQARSRSSATSGSGLGLAIVDTLVRAHGGTVSARNGAFSGATVTVEIPR